MNHLEGERRNEQVFLPRVKPQRRLLAAGISLSVGCEGPHAKGGETGPHLDWGEGEGSGKGPARDGAGAWKEKKKKKKRRKEGLGHGKLLK